MQLEKKSVSLSEHYIVAFYTILRFVLYSAVCNASNEELVFVVGTRAGLGVWKAMIDFVGIIVDGFSSIGQQGVRVSLIAFADRPAVAFYLHQFNTKPVVLDAVRKVDSSSSYRLKYKNNSFA